MGEPLYGTHNARFWVRINGSPVKLTLRPGEELSHAYGRSTDEGWYRRQDVWHFDGATVGCNWFEDQLDCDGRLDRYGTYSCRLSDLKALESQDDYTVVYPRWSHANSSQRDYAAEAAGY